MHGVVKGPALAGPLRLGRERRRLILVTIETETLPERHVFIRDMDELHKAIGRHIVLKRKGLTGQEVRFLRNTLNMTQSELASHLGNNAQSIALWENGKNDLPGDAEKLLRVFSFAKLATDEELNALREFVLLKLKELDEIDEIVTMPASFVLNASWAPSLSLRY